MRPGLVRIACKYASEKEDVMSAFQGNTWFARRNYLRVQSNNTFQVRIMRYLSSTKFGNREGKHVLADENDC